MTNNNIKELIDWGFTNEVCLKFYKARSRSNQPAQKIQAVRAVFETYARPDSPMRTFFTPQNLLSILRGTGASLASLGLVRQVLSF